MFRKVIKTTEIEIDGHRYAAEYFEGQTLRGGRRYSCEVMLDARDRIILDDDSMSSLESKVTRLAPATVYSRLLAGRPSVAA
jgi:hypothetical protein